MRLKYAGNFRTLDFSSELLSLTKDYENVSSVNDSGCVSTKERQTGNRRSLCSTSTPVNPSAGNGHRDSLSQFLPCNHCHLRHPFTPSLILILSPGRTWRSPSPRRSVFKLFSLSLSRSFPLPFHPTTFVENTRSSESPRGKIHRYTVEYLRESTSPYI